MKKIILGFILFICLFNYNNVYANNIVYDQDIELIKEKLDNNNIVYIELNNNDKLIAKRKALDSIKNKDKILIYNIKDNKNNILYTYKFNGKYFNKSYNDIDLNINFNTTQIIDNIFKTNKKIIINTNYKGNYPTGTILSISNNKKLWAKMVRPLQMKGVKQCLTSLFICLPKATVKCASCWAARAQTWQR